MESLTGKLLIAVPQLPDANFFRSVVIVLKHNDEGALGVIINRPSNVDLAQISDLTSGEDFEADDFLYMGGPVEGPLIALHSAEPLADDQVIEDVYFTMQPDHINQLIRSRNVPYKIFAAHSGWAPGQLENEIESGGWFVLPATEDHLFASDEELWKSVCEEFGTEILVKDRYRLVIPQDPSLN